MIQKISLFIFIFLLFSCKKEDYQAEEYKLNIPIGFPKPPIPADNIPTANKVALGKMLFFDPILSRDSTISCSSCHFEDKKFTDGKTVSIGIEGRKGIRNAPSLINAAYLPNMFWDGGVPNLEQQILAPIENVNEMDFNVPDVITRLNNSEVYKQLFIQAFGKLPDIYTFTRAVASFERTLLSGLSPYDDYTYNYNHNALNASEIRGMEIFMGERGECFHCHGSYLFTDHSFANNGLYTYYTDSGRARITLSPQDVGLFRVPSLRNIAHTAPYMHDGSLATLEEVIEHYNSGGKNHINKSPIIKPLHLTPEEKQDLLAFLHALSDDK
jgi:cytochrome c peroxidase